MYTLVRKELACAASGSSLAEPLNKSMNAILNLRLWIVTKQATSLRNIGVGLWHVPRLQRLVIDYCLEIQFLFQQSDQVAQLNGARLTQVKYFVFARCVIN